MKKSSKSTEQPLVSIVILNWKRPQDTLTCIDSVKKQTYKNIEIIVVENGSEGDSREILRKVKDIILVENPVNRGFTGGHIDGLKAAKGEFIFVLNNDAVVDSKYVTTAIDILLKDDKIAVVGGRSYQWGDEGNLFDTDNPFYAFQTINRYSMEGIFAQNDAGFDHEVNWVSGSAMVIRKSALEKSGYFFDPMFAYYEESDLFARIQANDYSIVYSPSLKIWHKDGASSSSYFQFYQLFKNRFVFGVRNLKSKDLVRFLRSYTKTTARGSYHHLFKKSDDENERTMNRALHGALGHSFATWPKWTVSRKTVKKHDSDGYDLGDRLKIEQTGISFVCDISKKVSNVTSLSDFIRSTSYRHYNSEFILVVDAPKKRELIQLLNSEGLAHFNIKLVLDTHQSKENSLNLGWLSASKEFVWFITPLYQPSIEKIKAACVKRASKEFSMYAGATETRQKTHTIVAVGQDICISRSILALYGGLDSPDLKTSLARLFSFAKQIPHSSVYSEAPSETDEIAVEANTLVKFRLILSMYAENKQKHTPYARALKKYYRLYQLHNTTVWLFMGGIAPRHKLARIRNTVLSALKLKRQELALELKHINNEVVKAKHHGYDQAERQTELASLADIALKDDAWKKTPVFIICRDRLTPLKQLLKWLDSVDMKNIILVDNDSIYPPLVEFLDSTTYQVIKTGKNIGHTVTWEEGMVKTLFPGKYYIVTDPDVIPNDEKSSHAIPYFYELHKKYIDYQKVGFGLKINDLPDYYALKEDVVAWEGQFWTNALEPNVYEAGIDTTFALYKPYTDYYTLHPSIRTGEPYVARHLPWYVDSTLIDEEEAFYRLHASQDITSWNTDEILDRYKKELAKN